MAPAEVEDIIGEPKEGHTAHTEQSCTEVQDELGGGAGRGRGGAGESRGNEEMEEVMRGWGGQGRGGEGVRRLEKEGREEMGRGGERRENVEGMRWKRGENNNHNLDWFTLTNTHQVLL